MNSAPRPAIIFVEVPVGGSPETLRQFKPGPYPLQQRSPWRPATRPPSKAEAFRRTLDLLRRLAEREADARRMLTPNAALIKASGLVRAA